MIEQSLFKAAWWLANPHLQTVYPTLTRWVKSPITAQERFELPDGDFVDLAWALGGLPPDAPLVIFLHGLGGDMYSTYAAGLLQAFNQSGWRAVLMHFRSASATPNRLPRAYHSGETTDLHAVLTALAEREPQTKKALVGVSLGGNVLLKWLGEQGLQNLVQAAVAVSVPFQLRSVADRINQGFSRVYQMHLLRRLRRVFDRKKAVHTEGLPEAVHRLETLRCFWTFDDQVTAPLHGYPHVHAYYRESSSGQYLSRITTPTLIIHALDDPFMTPDALPLESELGPAVCLELSQRGGHVGFISGSLPGRPVYWLDLRIPQFLRDFL